MVAKSKRKPCVLLDPHGRALKDIFRPEDVRRLHRIADVVWGKDEPAPPAVLRSCRRRVDAIVAGNWRHGRVEDWPRLKTIMEVGGMFVSLQGLDFDACFRRGVRVLCCGPAFAPAVAEMALGLTLAAARGIVAEDRAVHAGQEQWTFRGAVATYSLRRQRVGFIGFGAIAQALKPLLTPFDCRLQAYDPWLEPAELEAQGVMPVPLDRLLRTSKVIFVLAAPAPENAGMLDAAKLRLIRRGALLVLVSRASVVDFDALTDLILKGRLAAAIDVFPKEPLAKDHPIRQSANAILTPHRAGSLGRIDIGRGVVDDLAAIFAGREPARMKLATPSLVRRLLESPA